MNGDTRPRPQAPFLQRRYVELLTLGALLFVVQTGLVPFDFTTGGSAGSRVYFDATTYRLVLPDIISNIFLYVPLAGLLFLSLRRRLRSGLVAGLVAFACAALVSAGIEHLQYYSPSRVSSLIDLVSNMAGSVIGVLVAWVFHALVPRLVDAIRQELLNRPRASLVKGYVFALVVLACLPFSFSFDGTRLVQSVKSTHWVPFEAAVVGSASPGGAAVPSLASVHQEYAYRLWAALKCWSRWAAECASFVLFVWLLHPLLYLQYGFSRRATDALIWWFGLPLAAGLTLLQIPIMSRDADVTDVLFRVIGLALGVVLCAKKTTHASTRLRTGRPSAGSVRARWILTGVIAFIVYNGVIPLTMTTHGGLVAAASKAEFWPFVAYFVARFDIMMADVMEKFASYLVLAVVLTMSWRRVARCPLRERALWVGGVCVALSGVIELAQVYISVRVPSLTDPILAAVGAVVGVVGHAHVLVFYRRALALEEAGRRPGERMAPTRMGPTDELISTLAEPHPDAPLERPAAPEQSPHSTPKPK